jgi:hypothetical protein
MESENYIWHSHWETLYNGYLLSQVQQIPRVNLVNILVQVQSQRVFAPVFKIFKYIQDIQHISESVVFGKSVINFSRPQQTYNVFRLEIFSTFSWLISYYFICL